MSSNLTDSFVQEDQVQDDHSLLNTLQSNTSSASSVQLATMANSIISADRVASPGYSFTISDPPSPHFQLVPAFEKAIISHTIEYRPTFVVICDGKQEQEETDEDLVPSVKDIKKDYPDFFKKHPEVKTAIFRDQRFSEIVGTPEEAEVKLPRVTG